MTEANAVELAEQPGSEATPEVAPNSAPEAEPAEQISQPVSEAEPETEPEAKTEEAPAPEQQPKVEPSERERQYQAERDRAEAQLKNTYKQILPYVELDQYGNIVGPRKQQEPAIQESEIDQLLEAALLSGDKVAFNKLQTIREQNLKAEVKNELIRDFQSHSQVEQERVAIKKDYPNLFDEKGVPNQNDPLFIEANRVIEERAQTQPWLSHPMHVRTAIEIAESRLLKKNLPNIQQQLKNDAQTQLKKVAGNTVAVGSAGKALENSLALDSDQLARLRKEGFDEAGIARVSKIVKQAQKEGGFYL